MAGQKNGKEGYVLGWVVIMVLVLMILVTAILFASTAYYRQSFREYNDRQAYLTARSIVQTAAVDFTGSGSGELRDVLLDEISVYLKDEPDSESQAAPPDEAADKPTDKPTDKPDTGYPIPKIKFQLDSTMGSCTLWMALPQVCSPALTWKGIDLLCSRRFLPNTGAISLAVAAL